MNIQESCKECEIWELELLEPKASEINELELVLKENTEDLRVRAVITNYYFRKIFKSRDSKREAALGKHQENVLWVIQNASRSEIANQVYMKMHPAFNGTGFKLAEELWIDNVDSNPRDTSILSNAAYFFVPSKTEVARKLFTRLCELEPNNYKWRKELSHLSLLDTIKSDEATKEQLIFQSFTELETAYLMAEENEKFYLLRKLCLLAMKARSYVKAEMYAERFVESIHAEQKDDSGFYDYSKDIHIAFTVLGLIALEKNNIGKAKEYLLKSIESFESDVYAPFVPSMDLVRDLYILGEVNSVLNYLLIGFKVSPFYRFNYLINYIRIKLKMNPDFVKLTTNSLWWNN